MITTVPASAGILSFVHLNLHTEYSMLDSTVRIDALVDRARQLRLPALAITDHDNLFGLVKFYKACEAAGIKPLIGADVALRSPTGDGRARILVGDLHGYRALSRLLTRAYMQRAPDVCLALDDLLTEQRGLYLLLGDDSPVFATHTDSPPAWFKELHSAFGDRLYLELSRCGRAAEISFEGPALALAERMGLGVVASNRVRFVDADDYDAHEARCAIARGEVLSDPNRSSGTSREQWLKGAEQMARLYADLPVVLDNTLDLARRLNLELRFGTPALPAFPVAAGETVDERLRTEASKGLAAKLERYGTDPRFSVADYQARLDRELVVIVRMAYAGYFLVVADFIAWAKAQRIPVGPGRGSGAGSLVAWALAITDFDPLRYDLLFERFLNPERVSMPDFDIDFCMDRRDEVIRYVRARYGADKVAQIITYGTMAAKACVRDCGRVLGLPYGAVDSIARLIPSRPLDLTLSDALGLSQRSASEPELVAAELRQRWAAEDDEARAVLELALKLEGLTRNAGKHAGGVVISPTALTDYTPLYTEQGVDLALDLPVTQLDKDDVEAMGLIKFDFLGLRTLTILDWALAAINQRRAQTGLAAIETDRLALDDAATYATFSRAETVAIFQFESQGMQRLLRDARPDRFDDLIALVSLYRPGPMDLIPSYCARKHGKEPIEYADPRVAAVLDETYGIMVYQEQVMQMAQIVGGYTLGGADLLRRAMGKKKPEEMARQRVIFNAGAAANGLDEGRANAIFDLMEKFAGYGFNKSHAAAYALLAYQTAYLKTHYPAEFMAAVLSAEMDSTDKLVELIAEAQRMGLVVHGPDINRSTLRFVANGNALNYGLGAIRGLGASAIEVVLKARAAGPYTDLVDFVERIDTQRVSKRVIEALIGAGALDSFGWHRAALIEALPDALRMADQRQADRDSGQASLFADSSWSRTLAMPKVRPWSALEIAACELEVLGWYLTVHPVDAHRRWLSALGYTQSIAELLAPHQAALREPRSDSQRRPYVEFSCAALLTQARARARSRGTSELEWTLELADRSARLEATANAEQYEQWRPLLEPGGVALYTGQLFYLAFADRIVLRLKHVSALADALAQRTAGLRVRVGRALNAAQLLQLLDRHRGAVPVRLTIEAAGVCGDLALPGGVHASPTLVEELEALPGVIATELRYH